MTIPKAAPTKMPIENQKKVMLPTADFALPSCTIPGAMIIPLQVKYPVDNPSPNTIT